MLSTAENTLPETQTLLQAVAEELKIPLMYIARSAELATLNKGSRLKTLKELQNSAISTLELLDCYMLGLQLAENQQTLQVEPVSAKLVMHDVLSKLETIAKRYRVNLRLELNGTNSPVMTNRIGLQAALLSMGTAFIEAQTQSGNNKMPIVTLTAYKVPDGGLATGIYSTTCDITSAQLKAASCFYGKMRQPFGQLSSNSAAGIFIAQHILQAMAAQLKTIKHHKQVGIAAILQPSRQLQLV